MFLLPFLPLLLVLFVAHVWFTQSTTDCTPAEENRVALGKRSKWRCRISIPFISIPRQHHSTLQTTFNIIETMSTMYIECSQSMILPCNFTVIWLIFDFYIKSMTFRVTWLCIHTVSKLWHIMDTLRLQRSHTMFTLCSHRIRYVFVRAISTLWQIMYRLYLYLFHTMFTLWHTLFLLCSHGTIYRYTTQSMFTLCLHRIHKKTTQPHNTSFPEERYISRKDDILHA